MEKRNPMIYGQFLEHFHRQIYGGVYDPGNKLSDEDGFRKDVLKAFKRHSCSDHTMAGRLLCVLLSLEGRGGKGTEAVF